MKSRVMELRNSQELSREFIARILNLDIRVLERIETVGYLDSDFETMTSLAKAFGVDIEDLKEKEEVRLYPEVSLKDELQIRKLKSLRNRINVN